MEKFQLTYKRYGLSGLLIEWPQHIDKLILEDIQLFSKTILQSKLVGILDLNFVYCSLLILFDADMTSFDELKEQLGMIYQNKNLLIEVQNKKWKIPVCYDEEYGIDLKELSKEKGIEESHLITLHTDSIYTVYGMGFLPGFLYLGGLNKRLHTPRRSEPRLHLEKGSVAIGGEQTGIYPQPSPGGWHIIGRTPISIFDANRKTPSLVAVGDQIKFYSISKAKFELLNLEIESGLFKLEEI